MCGRYTILPDAQAWADLAAVLGEAVAEPLRDLPPRYNVTPTERVPIIVLGENGTPIALDARWGFIPPWWSKPQPPNLTTNCRSETAARLPMWREAWRHSRCLIPASGWYEWFTAEDGTKKPPKIPHHLQRQDGKQILFGGIWSIYQASPEHEPMATCAIVTFPSPPDIAEIHERTPLVLKPSYWKEWLSREVSDPGRVLEMGHEGAVEHFTKKTVKATVSKPQNKGPECIEEALWSEMQEQGEPDASSKNLRWLRETEGRTLAALLHDRLDGVASGAVITKAERRLWLREIGDRSDAESDLMVQIVERIRASLRQPVKTVAKKGPETSQGSLF